MVEILEDYGKGIGLNEYVKEVLWITKVLMPPHTALVAVYKGGDSAELNAMCIKMLPLCNLGVVYDKCCGK